MCVNVPNVPFGKAWLLGFDSLSLYLPFSISISTSGHILGPLLGERCCEVNDLLVRAYFVLVPLPCGLVFYI